MDDYFLSKEDWDTIVELGVGDIDYETVLKKKISPQAKAALTRKCVVALFSRNDLTDWDYGIIGTMHPNTQFRSTKPWTWGKLPRNSLLTKFLIMKMPLR